MLFKWKMCCQDYNRDCHHWDFFFRDILSRFSVEIFPIEIVCRECHHRDCLSRLSLEIGIIETFFWDYLSSFSFEIFCRDCHNRDYLSRLLADPFLLKASLCSHAKAVFCIQGKNSLKKSSLLIFMDQFHSQLQFLSFRRRMALCKVLSQASMVHR
jgi:hypothetical protein